MFEHDNSIIKLLSLPDDDLIIDDIHQDGDYKYVVIQKQIKDHYCPLCSSRMKSKGIYVRKSKHQIFQDGYKLILIVKQRRWWCDCCHNSYNDKFMFVNKHNQITNIIPYLILTSLKDYRITAKNVADRFNVSDTYVFYTVLRYLDIKRFSLPTYLCIDEVYLNIDNNHKYALILMDFVSKKIIDVVISRKQIDTEAYFYKIPYKERQQVKYLISDMYNQYLNFTNTYFHKAINIIDSFHVISWLNNKLNIYINEVIKRYKRKDKERLETKNYETNKFYNSIKESDEIYILNKFKWVLLSNEETIDYSTYYYEKRLCMMTDTYKNIKMFENLDEHFYSLRKLKQLYTRFNSNRYEDMFECESDFNLIIDSYSKCNERIFNEFSYLLKRYKGPILNSFIYVNERRLSNGLIEGFNHEIKDLKRSANGLSNFEYARNRIIWSSRDDIKVLSKPKPLKEIRHKTNKKRGSYKVTKK